MPTYNSTIFPHKFLKNKENLTKSGARVTASPTPKPADGYLTMIIRLLKKWSERPRPELKLAQTVRVIEIKLNKEIKETYS